MQKMEDNMSNDYTDNPGSPKKHKKRLHISFLSISPVISIVIIAALVIALIYTKKTASVSYQTDGKVTLSILLTHFLTISYSSMTLSVRLKSSHIYAQSR